MLCMIKVSKTEKNLPPVLMFPHPVTQLTVRLKNVLFAEARQTGLI